MNGLKKIIKYKPADYWHFFTRRIIRIYSDKFHYLTKDLEQCDEKNLMEGFDLDVKELTYEDFKNGFPGASGNKKLESIRRRLEDNTYKAFGIIENEKLIYVYWISFKNLDLPAKSDLRLNEDEALLIDGYCAEEYRGRGLHSKMTNYLLLQMLKEKKKKAVVIILDGNIPAYRVQIKTGFKEEKIFYIRHILGMSFISLKK